MTYESFALTLQVSERRDPCDCADPSDTSKIFPGVLEACVSEHLVGHTGRSETDDLHPVLVPAEQDMESQHHYR